MDRATRVARDLAARWGFKGFTLANIETVAWAYRFARHKGPGVHERLLEKLQERRRWRSCIQAEKARRPAIAMVEGTKSPHKPDIAGAYRIGELAWNRKARPEVEAGKVERQCQVLAN